ncbi:NADP-dependent oxidoreductase [Pseudoroseicyclus aestuarii]|uniref:NADPH:quinone reductase-like Zn-dependent oxidoreductase n=1 Tax=Pseudoroseicyclus aestuarii TaxID=1795041 RepID=A0A318T266_9RHOB|nr:NADP-dependent oxidoreductase [Pseudoroseicyclus aestuarii]PYE84304.1 NADPH:quinone reductase-like Zn-dependent oxidoreductase [Pseudoroseicyclus aestuarii]
MTEPTQSRPGEAPAGDPSTAEQGSGETMRVVRLHRFGGPEVLQLDEVERPVPGPGQLLVRVFASSVNPVDWKIREGGFPPVGEDALPFAMGRDVSGVVAARGQGIDSFDDGAEVIAMTRIGRGAYAQYAIVEPGDAAAKPASLGHEEAACLPLAGLTAWQALIDHGGLQEGQRVLIQGASGGVGHVAVQIARDRGAEVIVTARSEDEAFLKECGAAEVIDYRSERFEDRAGAVDLVIDLVGGETLSRSYGVLKQGGRLVSVVAKPDEAALAERGATGTIFMADESGVQLDELMRMVEQGRLTLRLDRSYPLDKAAEAQEAQKTEHVQGKIALSIP